MSWKKKYSINKKSELEETSALGRPLGSQVKKPRLLVPNREWRKI